MPLLALTVVGIACGLLVAVVQTPVYAARAVVLLPATGRDAKGQALRDMATEVRVAGSDGILKGAAASLGPSVSIRTLKSHVHLRTVSDDVLEFAGDSGSARQAAQFANATAEAYVRFSNGVDGDQDATLAQLQRQSIDLNDRIRKLGADVAAASASLAVVDPSSTEGIRLSASVASLRTEETDASRQLSDIRARLLDSLNRQGTRVLQPATPPSRPSRPRPVLDLGAGALAGFLAGLMLALVRQKGDRRVRARDDIAEIVGAPVLASITTPHSDGAATGRAFLQSRAPTATATEDLGLRQAMNLLGVAPGAGPAKVVVIALAGDTAASLLSARLAGFAAASGIQTTFVIGSRHADTRGLRTACHSLAAEGPKAVPNLEMCDLDLGAGDTNLDGQPGGEGLTVTLLVMESEDWWPPGHADRTAMVLAASSGFATEDQLAQAAAACLDAGHPLSGVLVANPDVGDHTTGRARWQGIVEAAGTVSDGGPLARNVAAAPRADRLIKEDLVVPRRVVANAERKRLDEADQLCQDAQRVLEEAMLEAGRLRAEAEQILADSRTEALRVLVEADGMLTEVLSEIERLRTESASGARGPGQASGHGAL